MTANAETCFGSMPKVNGGLKRIKNGHRLNNSRLPGFRLLRYKMPLSKSIGDKAPKALSLLSRIPVNARICFGLMLKVSGGLKTTKSGCQQNAMT